MLKLWAGLLFFIFAFYFAFQFARAQKPPGPLKQDELLGLTAGAALPENIVAAIEGRNLGFAVDDAFRAQMEKAGADKTILAALGSAKTNVTAGAKERPKTELLEHLSGAGKLMGEKDYDDAVKELDEALKISSECPHADS